MRELLALFTKTLSYWAHVEDLTFRLNSYNCSAVLTRFYLKQVLDQFVSAIFPPYSSDVFVPLNLCCCVCVPICQLIITSNEDEMIRYASKSLAICTLILVLVPHISYGVLLPKRIVSQISEKIKIPNYSSFELDEAFNLGKNMVVEKLRHENDLIKEGIH